MQTNPDLHARLNHFNRQRLTPGLPLSRAQLAAALEAETDYRLLEEEFVSLERQAISKWAASAPTSPDAFVEWFVGLKENGPGQQDPLFRYLAEGASYEEMRWFLRQEVAGEAGFEDLTALAQVKQPAQAKLELARNYWDELGRGFAKGMHGPMLERLAHHFGVAGDEGEPIVWEAQALGNLLVAFAANRRYAYHALGALGVIELTAPGRAEKVNLALKRLNVPPQIRQYFAVHAVLDVKHSKAWNREVLAPLVAERPEVAVALAEGALMRLQAGARCFERYRRELGLMPVSEVAVAG